jgi:hypothetical protein
MVAIEMLTNLNTISMEDLVDRMHVEKATNVEDVKDGVRGCCSLKDSGRSCSATASSGHVTMTRIVAGTRRALAMVAAMMTM